MLELSLTKKCDEPIVLGLGFFDCVHLGHRALIQKVHELALKHSAKSAITTFSNNPYKVFNSDSKLIFTYDERKTIFSSLNLDFCLPFKFDLTFKEIDKDAFLDLLFSNFNIKAIVCGYDYLFGSGGKGDATDLAKACKSKNIEICIVDPILYNQERVSSTLVKSCIENGNIKKVNTYLTTLYFMEGVVVSGRGEGHKFGIPTANLSFSKNKLLLKSGVYSTYTIVDGIKRESLTSIGTKPTFNDNTVSVETFILDADCGDLYGKAIRIEFLNWIREIRKFNSSKELSNQIQNDINF